MEGDNQTREQQHGGQLHRQNVRPKQRDTHLFGVNRRAVDTLIVNAENGVNDHHQQHRGENGRANPDPGFQPLTFLFDFAAARAEHHHHEHEQHHNGARINDNFQRAGEVSPSEKNTPAIANSEMIRYSSACTGFVWVITRRVARMAIRPQI